MDKEKALYYTELAAMGGDADARRHSLADSAKVAYETHDYCN